MNAMKSLMITVDFRGNSLTTHRGTLTKGVAEKDLFPHARRSDKLRQVFMGHLAN